MRSDPVKSIVGERCLIDNSAWQRRLAKPEVRDAFHRAVDEYKILVCPPIAAEVGYSVRDRADQERTHAWLHSFLECPVAPSAADVLTIYEALMGLGLHGAVGAVDTVIAAYALADEATLLHYDRDFDYVATAVPEFQHRWIVPPGSVA